MPSPPVASAASPWELPAEDLASQRLFRVRFEGEEGQGRFRLTLRLLDSDRFQLRAVDALGRSVWTLHTENGETLLLDHRQRRACTLGEKVDLTELYLGSFPARDLPALILGKLPAVPAQPPLWTGSEDGSEQRLEFTDQEGRRWLSRVREGRVTGWSVSDVGGMILAFLELQEDGLRLVDRQRGLEVRWREVAAEPLRGGLVRPEIPASYAVGGCFGPSEEEVLPS